MTSLQGCYQRMAWYVPARSPFCRLVPLDEQLYAEPTESQQDLVVCPESDPDNAGHWFGRADGQLFNLN